MLRFGIYYTRFGILVTPFRSVSVFRSVLVIRQTHSGAGQPSLPISPVNLRAGDQAKDNPSPNESAPFTTRPQIIRPLKKPCLFPISYRPCSITCYSKVFSGVKRFNKKIPSKHTFLVILHLIIMFILFRMYFYN